MKGCDVNKNGRITRKVKQMFQKDYFPLTLSFYIINFLTLYPSLKFFFSILFRNWRWSWWQLMIRSREFQLTRFFQLFKGKNHCFQLEWPGITILMETYFWHLDYIPRSVYLELQFCVYNIIRSFYIKICFCIAFSLYILRIRH